MLFAFEPVQMGNGCFHSPVGKHVVSEGPRKPYPLAHENEALPPTSRDNIATRGTDRFDEDVMGISPHSIPVVDRLFQ